jgi:hypothetical protein
VDTTGDGAVGFLRLYPTQNHETTVQSPIPSADTLYIGWDIDEQGASCALTALSLLKLTSVDADVGCGRVMALAGLPVGRGLPSAMLDAPSWVVTLPCAPSSRAATSLSLSLLAA